MLFKEQEMNSRQFSFTAFNRISTHSALMLHTLCKEKYMHYALILNAQACTDTALTCMKKKGTAFIKCISVVFYQQTVISMCHETPSDDQATARMNYVLETKCQKSLIPEANAHDEDRP